MKKLQRLFFIILLVVTTGCYSTGKKADPGVTANLKTIRVTDDIPYREGIEKCVLDLAMPENFGEEIRPVIVLIHGGGWRAGSKQERVFRCMLLDYAYQGYVTISIDYRLNQDAAFPACIEDVKCAVRWLKAHNKELRIDPNRIGTYGHSAGAHLAVMLAVSNDNKDLEGDGPWQEYSSGVACAVGGATPTEIGNSNNPWSKYPEWWPIGYISADRTPVLLLQGEADPIVKEPLVKGYYDKMKSVGANVEYIMVPDLGHDVSYTLALNITKPAMDEFFAK